MAAPDSLDDRLQDDVVARLSSDSFFADILLIEERKGTAATQVAQALAGELPKAEKFGAFLIVEMPSSIPKEELPGPQETFALRVLVRVIPKINNLASGTQKDAGRIKRRVNALLHLWAIEQSALIVTECLPYSDDAGTVGYDITVEWQCGEEPLAAVATPKFSGPASAIVLTCATAGATIYYTTDESPPWPDNPDATEYTGPIVNSGTTDYRAAAFKTGLVGSGIARARYEADNLVDELGNQIVDENANPIVA